MTKVIKVCRCFFSACPFFSHMLFLYTLEQHLLTFWHPQDRLTGSDLISKLILKESKVVDLITQAMLDVSSGTYIAVGPTKWSDGTRSDVVYIPHLSINKTSPPILIKLITLIRLTLCMTQTRKKRR